jgi:hypothetical protein
VRLALFADLDETLRQTLIRYVPLDPTEVEVSFETPDREWSGGLTRPAINCFLYDVRENHKLRLAGWEARRDADGRGAGRQKGPLRINATYQVTTWARAHEDEHRLLWRVLAALMRHPILPQDLLAGQLRQQPYPIPTHIAQPEHVPTNVGDLWGALDNRIRPSLTYVVTLALEPELVVSSPLVLSAPKIGVRQIDPAEGRDGLVVRGRVRDRNDPARTVPGALVLLSETGDRAMTDEEGRFRFAGVRRGPITLVVRANGRTEMSLATRAPADSYELEV